jgi:outer membrane protein TolC
MVRALGLFATLLALLAPAAASAQEALTLDQAVRATLTGNPALRGARAAAAADAARVTEARSAWYPRISVTESWQRGDQPVFVFGSLLSSRQFAAANFAIDSLNHPDATGFFRTSVGVEQILFDGGRTRSAAEGAALQHEMSTLEASEAAAGLVLAATQAYGRILAADAGRRAADAALQAAREDVTRAGHRRDAGTATDADVLALAAHAAQMEQRAIQQRGDAAVARAELNRLMGVAITRDYEVVEPPPLPPSAESGADLDALLARTEGARPELRRAAAAGRAADAAGRTARTALVPQIAAQAAFDVSGTAFADRASAWLIGGEMRWNLSLGGAELARMKAATESRLRAAAHAEDVRAAVQVEVVSAFRRLEAARARQAAGRAAVDDARESERIVRDRFDAGMANVTDVLRASSAVLDAEAQRISAAVDAMVSRAMLDRAVGSEP